MADVELSIRAKTETFEAAMKRAASTASMVDAGFRRLSDGALRLNAATNQLTTSRGRFASAEQALNALGVQTTQQIASQIAAVDALAKHYDMASAEGRQLAAIKRGLIATADGHTMATQRSGRNLMVWSQAANDAQQFAYGWQQGLIAISNQIPQLIEGLGGASKAGRLLQASLGWITLGLSAGMTAAIIFGDEISDAFNRGTSSADALKDAMEDIIEVEKRRFRASMTLDQARQFAQYAAQREGQAQAPGAVGRLVDRGVAFVARGQRALFGDISASQQAAINRSTEATKWGLAKDEAEQQVKAAEAVQEFLDMLKEAGVAVEEVKKKTRNKIDTELERATKALSDQRGVQAEINSLGADFLGTLWAQADALEAINRSMIDMERSGALLDRLLKNPEALRQIALNEYVEGSKRARIEQEKSLAVLDAWLKAHGSTMPDLFQRATARLGGRDTPASGGTSGGSGMRRLPDGSYELDELDVAARGLTPRQEAAIVRIQQAIFKRDEALADAIAESIYGGRAGFQGSGDALARIGSQGMSRSMARIDRFTSARGNTNAAYSDAWYEREKDLARGRGDSARVRELEIEQERIQSLEQAYKSFADTLGGAFAESASAAAEAFGRLVVGQETAGGAAAAILTPLADAAIHAGKIIMATGFGLEALKNALKTWATGAGPVLAIGAGAALIAIGSAAKAGLAAVASGGSGGGARGGFQQSAGSLAFGRTLPGGGDPGPLYGGVGASWNAAPLMGGGAVLNRLASTLDRIERTGIPVTGTLEARAGAVQAGLSSDARRSRILSTRY